MGIILPAYKKAILDDVIGNIASNNSFYYAFAANPVNYTGNTPAMTFDDYSDQFTNDWQLIFGKLITSTDILPVIQNNLWSNGVVYTQYDNTSNTLFANNNYYTVSPPVADGAPYQIYKCIYNANNGPSTVQPTIVQPTSFQTSDGYIWRYIATISSANYSKFSSGNYMPIYPNSAIQSSASVYAGVEVVVINNGGNYQSYYNGVIQGGNSSILQIDGGAFPRNDFYTNNSIYLYQNSSSFSQIRTVTNYVSNTSGNWVIVDSPFSNASIGQVVYNYIISPQVKFKTDGDISPVAYSVINTTSNAISSIVILNTGSNISWANVSIYSNNVITPANVYAIVPPPGGHGSNPLVELGVQGFSAYFAFSNSESNTIPTNISYNKIGIIKNPSYLNANNTQGNSYTSNTFNQLLVANVSTTFAVGTTVVGQNSGALGTVAFSNSTQLYLTGDKKFKNNETVVASSNNLQNTVLTISSLGNLYAKNINPLYITNINNINRSNNQVESYNLIVQI
jgi:hypothetical protein